MTPIVQPIVSLLVGLALSFYGVAHSVARYPGTAAFARLADVLPSLGAVLLFALGLLAALAGLVLLVRSARLLRTRWRQLAALTARQRYGDAEDGPEWGPAYR
jgi:hypothetical protein